MNRKVKPKNPVFYPLCEAVIHDDMASFNELVETGVEIDGTDYNGLTALFYAAEYGVTVNQPEGRTPARHLLFQMRSIF